MRAAAGRRRSALVWDVGCNDGRYSRIAAENSDLVVAFDADHATVDATYRALRDEGREDILPLVMSVTDPSPDLGWRGRERASLERRGTPDLALCLAVVHHVCITGNVPVREFLDWLRSLDTALVIEFPDRSDPMVERLLSGKRDGSNPDYDAAVFESALAERFTIDQKSPVSATRTLFEARPRGVTFPRAALHLGGLWALAFAQPLFQLLGRNAEFFVARGSTAGDILVLAFAYTLVPPLVLATIAWGLGKLRPALGWGAMLAFVGLIVAAFVLPPVGDLLGGSALAVPVALALGAGAAYLYARVSGVRSFATLIAVAPVVVLVLFLIVSPVRGLLFPSDAGGSVTGPAQSSTPIVHVVLDELPLSTLVGTDGKIDARMFPNFARLARESTWYRNGTTVDDLTAAAVPAQLTGSRAPASALPTTSDYPRSLFTLFGRSHDLTVVEPITALCPERLCGSTRPGTWDRLTSLETDLEVVVKQQLYPEDLREGLPAIDRVWEGFEQDQLGGDGELASGANLRRDVLARLHRDNATAGWEKAIAALRDRGAKPQLVFLHSTLPHGPWRFLPDGKQYPTPGNGYLGLAPEGWVGPQWQVDQEFQRHVLQVQYVDRLLGRLLDALPDDAVLVVAADHGSAFVSGEPKRPIEPDNAGAIAPVPFFVKLPGQTAGRVDDRAVRTMDILPTIAKAAGDQAAVEGAGRARRRARRGPGRRGRRLPPGRAQAHRAARRDRGTAARA